MTPFGEKLSNLRKQRDISQKNMASALGVSAAYLSALEHGQRGKPQWSMVQKIITFFNVIWDEAEELQYLASISDPKVKIDTVDLSPEATKLANLLAKKISTMSAEKLSALVRLIETK